MDFGAPIPLPAAQRAALETRATVNAAVGLIMIQNGWSRDQSLAYLLAASIKEDRALALIAKRVLRNARQQPS